LDSFLTMIKIKWPSLELNWLPNSLRKGLDTPQILIGDNPDYGGCYYNVQDYVDDELDLTKKAVIIITDTDRMESVIAHEFRHHWQTYTWGKLPTHPWQQGKSYKKSIKKYFRGARHEMDALQFEIKYAPNNLNLKWWEWLQE